MGGKRGKLGGNTMSVMDANGVLGDLIWGFFRFYSGKLPSKKM